MSGLQLGDCILDPECFIYVPSLQVIACSGIQHAFSRSTPWEAKHFFEKFEIAIGKYPTQSIIFLGSLQSTLGLRTLHERLGRKYKLIWISSKPSIEAVHVAEGLGFEVHQQLAWDHFRFKEANPNQFQEQVQMSIFTVASIRGDHQPTIKLGKNPFRNRRLPVFLKGHGRLLLPSVSPMAEPFSVLIPKFNSYDAFAAGHARVLPLGKVKEIRKTAGISGRLPLKKKTLGGSRSQRSQGDLQ